MDLKKEAATLTEKIYAIKGTNQANEVQRLLEVTLRCWYNKGQQDGYVPMPGIHTND